MSERILAQAPLQPFGNSKKKTYYNDMISLNSQIDLNYKTDPISANFMSNRWLYTIKLVQIRVFKLLFQTAS